MGDLFQLNNDEVLTFFAVLVRYSILFAVLPFVGDKLIPMPVKVLLSLAVTVALYPALVARGQVTPSHARLWGATSAGIAGTIGMEVMTGLVMGFIARLSFETITFGSNLVGTFMGFAAASMYDPHQESQSQVVAQIQMAVAMLLFLAMDGHHVMLRAALESYRIIGIGGGAASGLGDVGFGSAAFSAKLISLTGDVVKFGIQIATPVAVALFSVNVAFGIMGKAMPQMNVMVLSFAVTAGIGLVVMMLGLPEFSYAVHGIMGRMGDSMNAALLAVATGK